MLGYRDAQKDILSDDEARIFEFGTLVLRTPARETYLNIYRLLDRFSLKRSRVRLSYRIGIDQSASGGYAET